MTYTHYADMFITLMLGWIRGVTNWIWSMIRLGRGSAGRNFLSWFSSHWLQMVLVLLLAGVAMDWLVWLVRWRPYWLWFGKKRRLVNDTPESPRRREQPREEEETVERRAAAPQFHSQALPRRHTTVPPEDLFDVAPSRAAKTPSAPDDLFDVKPSAPDDLSGEAHRKPMQPDSKATPRSENDGKIDWFE